MKANDIIDEVLARLRQITPANGYVTTVAEVTEYWDLRQLDSPLCGVTITVTPLSLAAEFRGKSARLVLPLSLECLLPISPCVNPRVALNELLADIFQALGMADTRLVGQLLGGLATTLEMGEINYAPPDGGSNHVRAIAPLTVTFTDKFS